MAETSVSGEHLLEYRDEGGSHEYWLDGVQVFGVTTAGKRGYPASKNILDWQAKHSARFAINKAAPLMKSKGKITKKQIEEIAKESVDAYKDALGDAADIGTIVHDYAYHTESGKHYDMSQWDGHKDLKKIQACLRGFNKWKASEKSEAVSLEALVASPEKVYAGRFDRLAKRGQLLVLDDYKTSSGFYMSQFVQAAGYRRALREWRGDEVGLLRIIRMDKFRGQIETRTSQELAQLFKVEHDELLQLLDEQFLRNLETAQFRQKFD